MPQLEQGSIGQPQQTAVDTTPQESSSACTKAKWTIEQAIPSPFSCPQTLKTTIQNREDIVLQTYYSHAHHRARM